MSHRPAHHTTALVAFAVAALVACFAAPVFAVPESLNHRDPKAPCFRWPALDYDGDGIFDRLDHCNNTPKGCIVDEWGCPLDADGDGVCDGNDKCPDTPNGEEVDENGCSKRQRDMMSMGRSTPTRPSGEAPKAVAPATPPPPPPTKPVSEVEKQLIAGGRVRLENIYFETASANLLPESEATLTEAGQALEKFADLRIEVGGHTDTRGASAYNMRLSQARAESVRRYLLDHFNLRSENLLAKGYGETQPETQERNDEERLRNRRVELKVLNPEALPSNVKIENH